MASRFRRRGPPLFLLVFFPRCFVRLGEKVNQNGNNRNAGSACETNPLPWCVVFIDCCTTHLPRACEQTVANCCRLCSPESTVLPGTCFEATCHCIVMAFSSSKLCFCVFLMQQFFFRGWL
uniref:Putative secreted protein n=1 Tax=Ixodes scapularis TaxID=6945 RepID=A0A4D5RDG5_IXOSC